MPGKGQQTYSHIYLFFSQIARKGYHTSLCVCMFAAFTLHANRCWGHGIWARFMVDMWVSSGHSHFGFCFIFYLCFWNRSIALPLHPDKPVFIINNKQKMPCYSFWFHTAIQLGKSLILLHMSPNYVIITLRRWYHGWKVTNFHVILP